MKNLNTLQKALIAGVVVAAFGLAGCEADGNGLESGGIIGDGSDNGGLGANDGSTPTTVNEDLDDDGTAETVIDGGKRSEEHTSELQSLMRNSYAAFCLQKKHTLQPK